MTDDDGPRIHFEINRPNLRVGMVTIDELKVGQSTSSFEAYEQDIFNEIRSQMTLEDAKDNPIFRSYRDLYWSFGMDPTKLRVSSEAVLRRILKGLNLWRISDIVDIINLASAYHKIPIGLIDALRLDGDLIIRSAHKGEIFQRIGGKTITCRGREIVVVDEKKIVCFGYATHDSEFTMVTKNSERVFVLLYGAEVVTRTMMEDALKITVDMISQWLDCTVSKPVFFRSES
jgi:DNA/RNA-binding domain of Phe-tRNA-synthetase-like protein